MTSRWTIQIKKGSTVKELILNREPLPTWPFGTLGETGKLNVASTRMLQIDSTPEADTFFEMMKEVNVVTDLPRRQLECNLLYDGSPVMENCKVSNLTFSGKSYKVILATDNAELIQLLDNDLSALDLSAFEIGYTAAAQLATYDPTAPDQMLYIKNYYKADEDSTLLDNEFNLPLVSISSLYNEILTQNGLTSNVLAVNDFENDNNFKKKYIQLTTRDANKNNQGFGTMGVAYDVPQDWSSGAQIAHAPDSINYSFQSSEFWSVDNKTFNYIDLNSPSLVNEPVVVLNFPVESIVVRAVSQNTGLSVPSNCKIVVAHYKTEGATEVPYAIKQVFQNTAGTQEVSFADTEVGDYFVLLGVRENTGSFFMHFDIELAPGVETYQYDEPTSLYKLKDNIPDIKQIDIIKYIMNTFALFADFDTVNKQIVFYDYGHLLEQYTIGNVIDLTEFVVDVENVGIDFNGSLAQRNYLSFDNADGVLANAGRGVYEFDSDNVNPERQVYKAPFSYSNTFNTFAVLPYAVQPEPTSTPSLFELEEIGLRIVDVEVDAAVCFAKLTNVDFQQNINNYYVDFENSNEDFKIVSITALLPMPIVRNLISKTSKMPILLQYSDGEKQVNGIFKLNSINKWTDKRGVNLELKKLI